ncbi:unnamed protein product [Coregonus sp. 'balchen']|nr:unnamed protein product [Coregonus sp. 'balchen']
MPSNTVATTNTAAFQSLDYTCDAPGNRMRESTILDKELVPEEKPANSNTTCKEGQPAGRKHKQIPAEGSVSVKDSVARGGGNSRTGVAAERERTSVSVAQVHNGDVSSGHADRDRDRTQADASGCPKQERKAPEKNGLPGAPGSPSAPASQAEEGPPGLPTLLGQSRSLSPPSLENRFLVSRKLSREPSWEPSRDDSDKDKEETLTTPPRKKRGRRKLERPTKCES